MDTTAFNRGKGTADGPSSPDSNSGQSFQSWIGFLKRIRKRSLLQNKYNSDYAFIGVGNHSLNNLYPVIHYLHIPLKYIVVKSRETADLINENQPVTRATTDLESVLNDTSVSGIFICANPDSHYDLVKKCMLHRKNVFVEKPPCKTIEELKDLIDTEKATGSTCLAGLQKRYSSCVTILKKQLKIKDVISYNYRFLLGACPEGNPLWDLYIHPLDLITFLFGETELLSLAETKSSPSANSLFLQTKHNQLIGSVEMSTQYSWNRPLEYLSINTGNGIYTLENHQSLTFESKSGNILSVPREKIFHTVPEKKYLFEGNRFLPVFENNQIVSQGYFPEIKTFASLCENMKSKNRSSLCSLLNTYELMTKIEKNV
ncbi:MAG: Gfo/Idh/MocA family oxidoreductase [Tannerella sp.]|jgi:virulence factor|nr:Gfo/Idh/MocA family oxidoreductase [Tannerella sp.]